MDQNLKLLVTMYNELGSGGLVKVAIKFSYDLIPDDLEYFPESFLEPSSLDFIKSLLPEHLLSIGPIVSVERIMDIFELAIDYGEYE